MLSDMTKQMEQHHNLLFWKRGSGSWRRDLFSLQHHTQLRPRLNLALYMTGSSQQLRGTFHNTCCRSSGCQQPFLHALLASLSVTRQQLPWRSKHPFSHPLLDLTAAVFTRLAVWNKSFAIYCTENWSALQRVIDKKWSLLTRVRFTPRVTA